MFHVPPLMSLLTEHERDMKVATTQDRCPPIIVRPSHLQVLKEDRQKLAPEPGADTYRHPARFLPGDWLNRDPVEGDMSILVWIVLGLIAGWLAGLIMGTGGYGLIGDVVVGIIGALLGGALASAILGVGVTGLDLTSIVISVIGAIIFIALYRAVVPGARARV
jgi:uncharacterized membrane protein YeaQ/YmgE (transglycosylase-associated protein family)